MSHMPVLDQTTMPPAAFWKLLARAPRFAMQNVPPAKSGKKRPVFYNAFQDVKKHFKFTPDKPGQDTWGITSTKWVKTLTGKLWRVVYGDCDDFVFLCVDKLLQKGVPLGAMRYVVCEIAPGRGHLVLAVDVEDTTLILDNRRGGPTNWGHRSLAAYKWLAASQPGALMWRKMPMAA